MRTRFTILRGFIGVFAVLGALGLAASLFILSKQRAPLPFQDYRTLKIEFSEADGVVSGIGQPVNIAGVKVGQVVDVDRLDGRALVTAHLQRDGLPPLYADAVAVLEPITPLKDMQIAVDPGDAPRSELPDEATISLARTQVPVPLSDLLSTLDTDTRAYLGSLLTSLDQGTAGRGADLREMLTQFGPTVAQTRRVTEALARRRTEVARLVHNLAALTEAASRDGRLTEMIQAGNATLAAVAREDVSLQQSLERFPGTLRTATGTLQRVQPFGEELSASMQALRPALQAMPAALRSVAPFAEVATPTLRDDVRPFVRVAQPLLAETAPSIADLDRSTPDIRGAAQTFNYFLNEMAFNPEGDDEGFLFWIPWALHNLNSFYGPVDAHGGMARATVFAKCDEVNSVPDVKRVLNLVGVCGRG